MSTIRPSLSASQKRLASSGAKTRSSGAPGQHHGALELGDQPRRPAACTGAEAALDITLLVSRRIAGSLTHGSA